MRGGIEASEALLQAGGVRTRRPRDDKPKVPYVTLRLLFDQPGGTTGCPWDEVDEFIQGTVVASDDTGALWMQDRIYELLRDAPDLTIVQLPSGPVNEDDDTAGPSLFYAYPRWRLMASVADYQEA